MGYLAAKRSIATWVREGTTCTVGMDLGMSSRTGGKQTTEGPVHRIELNIRRVDAPTASLSTCSSTRRAAQQRTRQIKMKSPVTLEIPV